MTLSRMRSSGRAATFALFTIIGAWLSAAALAQTAEPTSTTPEDDNASSVSHSSFTSGLGNDNISRVAESGWEDNAA